MKQRLLNEFPITFAFVTEVAVRMKGETPAFWKNELNDYHLLDKCRCGECHTFYLIPSSKSRAFNRGDICAGFGEDGDTLVILHANKLGQLIEVELPLESDIPFLDEYENILNESYFSTVTEEEAQKTVNQWFEKHQEHTPAILVLDE